MARQAPCLRHSKWGERDRLTIRERLTMRGGVSLGFPAAFLESRHITLPDCPTPSRNTTKGSKAPCYSRRHSALAAYLNRGLPLPWRRTTCCPTLPHHTTLGLRAVSDLRRRFAFATFLNRGIPPSWRLTTVGVTQKFPSLHRLTVLVWMARGRVVKQVPKKRPFAIGIRAASLTCSRTAMRPAPMPSAACATALGRATRARQAPPGRRHPRYCP